MSSTGSFYCWLSVCFGLNSCNSIEGDVSHSDARPIIENENAF